MMATTKDVLAEERFITGFALAGRATMKAAGVPEGLGRGILDDDQWRGRARPARIARPGQPGRLGGRHGQEHDAQSL